MMKTFLVLFFFSALSCSSVWCQDATAAKDSTASVPVASAVDVPVAPVAAEPAVPAEEPVAPAEAPAAPADEPADSTTVPADPTVPDVTTTAAPDTTTSTTTTTTTTASTTTTTTASTTTTAAPTPAPAVPERGMWSVTDDTSSSICVLAQMATQMTIPYLGSTNKTLTAVISVPANASSEGSCQGNEYIRVYWPAGAARDQANFVMITFAENSTAGRYSVDSINVQLSMDDTNFPDHADDSPMLNLSVNFSEPISLSNQTSYRCMSKQPFQLLATDGSSGELLMLETQLEAYRTVNTTKFSTPLVCSADHKATSDVVPIAVGVALASLVVIILIAYIVGRRRARQRGYQSV